MSELNRHLKALEFAKDSMGVEAINLGTGNGPLHHMYRRT